MVAYSIRHKVTTILRRYQVPSDQVNVQLGPRRPSNRTSDLYGEYEPNYLGEAAAAIDAFTISLQRFTKRSLFYSRGTPADEQTAIVRLHEPG